MAKPFGRPRFRAEDRSKLPSVNAADHFGRWLKFGIPGAEPWKIFIACLPGEQRGLAREAVLERRFAAERALQELNFFPLFSKPCAGTRRVSPVNGSKN